VQQATKSWKPKEWEAMGLDELIDTQLYMRRRRQCDDSLPEKKRCHSVSTTYAIHMGDRGAKKFESLKYFKVCGVLKKEPIFNEQDQSIRSAWSFTQSVKRSAGVTARSCYQV
jgi:hypothetical protein